jgi:NADPH2:quinone reductase
MRAYGPPEVLGLEKVALPELGPSELRIRTLAAAVNHSDLEIRAGRWPVRREPQFPYVPGLEVIGEVVEVGPEVDTVAVGEQVWTMMQGLGGVRARRAGGYQEHVTVDADAVAPVPESVDAWDAAALGLAAVTAHQGFEPLGPLEGRRVAVTGAAGGVGSAGVGLAAARGAEVVAVVRTAAASDYLRSIGAAEIVDDVTAIPARSLDVVLDTVAGPLFEPLVEALRPGGGLSVVGAMGGERVSVSAWALVRGVTLTGYTSETLDGSALRRVTADIFSLHEAARLRPPAWRTIRLEDAPEAHRLLERGGVEGRVLLVP